MVGDKSDVNGYIAEPHIRSSGNVQFVATTFDHLSIMDCHILAAMGFQQFGQQMTKRTLFAPPLVLRHSSVLALRCRLIG